MELQLRRLPLLQVPDISFLTNTFLGSCTCPANTVALFVENGTPSDEAVLTNAPVGKIIFF